MSNEPEPEIREYALDVMQGMSCRYIVSATSPREAWRKLLRAEDAECVEQYPEGILSDFDQIGIEVRDLGGDWETVR